MPPFWLKYDHCEIFLIRFMCILAFVFWLLHIFLEILLKLLIHPCIHLIKRASNWQVWYKLVFILKYLYFSCELKYHFVYLFGCSNNKILIFQDQILYTRSPLAWEEGGGEGCISYEERGTFIFYFSLWIRDTGGGWWLNLNWFGKYDDKITWHIF